MLKDIKQYDTFNREERAICAHLFRLLHHNLDKKEESPLGKFIDILSTKSLVFTPNKRENPLQNLDYSKNVAIYCEVALIRDYYNICSANEKEEFLDKVIQIIDNNQNICTSISELKRKLKNNKLPHPSRIKYNFKDDFKLLPKKEREFYNTLQGVFNAKPDMAITIDNILGVGEAKLTEPFDTKQLKLTHCIAQIWSELLYKNLGFIEQPHYAVFKIGKTNTKRTVIKSDIDWLEVYKIAQETYINKKDRTLLAIKAGVGLQNLNIKL